MSLLLGISNIIEKQKGNRYQNLRNFTVQICNVDNDKIVGTGIAVSTDGNIATCAHIVRDAGVDIENSKETTYLSVIFPQTLAGKRENRLAKVASHIRPKHDDDIVLLELVEDDSLLSSDHVAVLGDARESAWNEFRSYGYRNLDKFESGWASGTILDCVESPKELHLLLEPVQLKSPEINVGMSGAAVLDVKRNLVVGIISDTWIPDQSMKDRDTGWAVNASLLAFKPFNLMIREVGFPLRPSHLAFPTIPNSKNTFTSLEGTRIFMNDAPIVPSSWVGRKETLRLLTKTWDLSTHQVVGLIGFAGEGKSTIISHWITDLIRDSSAPQPEVIFWWNFSGQDSVDEFLDEALSCISSNTLNPADYPTSIAKLHFLAGIIHTIRCIVVLDGLESLQSVNHDQFGQINNIDLQQLLLYFLTPGHSSLCLVTSRIPLNYTLEYSTYLQCNIDGLQFNEGLELLQNIGAKGAVVELKAAATALHGHPLALTLLANQPDEQIAKNKTLINNWFEQKSSKKTVFQLLKFYEQQFSETERRFAILICTVRTPLSEAAIKNIFHKTKSIEAITGKMSDADTHLLINRLIQYQILEHGYNLKVFSIHPLVRQFFSAQVTKHEHLSLMRYYLDLWLAKSTKNHHTLESLSPAIEATFHACRAGEFTDAINILQDYVFGEEQILTYKFCAWATGLSLFIEFFENQDITKLPIIENEKHRAWIFSQTGLCLKMLGRLKDSIPLYKQAKKLTEAAGDVMNATNDCINLAQVYVDCGDLDSAKNSANSAVKLGQEARSKYLTHPFIRSHGTPRVSYPTTEAQIVHIIALVYDAMITHLSGDMKRASLVFKKAEDLERSMGDKVKFLAAGRGVIYSEYLLRTDEIEYARAIREWNLSLGFTMSGLLGDWHRILGKIEEKEGKYIQALANYTEALTVARNHNDRLKEIEALVARGRLEARKGVIEPARMDLTEAIYYTTSLGYSICEVDARIGMAWLHLSDRNITEATAEAKHARAISNEIGYHWGKIDTIELFEKLK